MTVTDESGSKDPGEQENTRTQRLTNEDSHGEIERFRKRVEVYFFELTIRVEPYIL